MPPGPVTELHRRLLFIGERVGAFREMHPEEGIPCALRGPALQDFFGERMKSAVELNGLRTSSASSIFSASL